MKFSPMGTRLFHMDCSGCRVRHTEAISRFVVRERAKKNFPIRGIFVMRVSCAVVFHTWNTIVILCDVKNIMKLTQKLLQQFF